MTKWLAKTVTMFLLLIGAAAGGFYLYQQTTAARKIRQLEEEKRVLEQVVTRLTTEKRVAEIVVTEKQVVNGVTRTKLLFVESTKGGATLEPREFEVVGAETHIDAKVIKFERDFVKSADPLRGHSIALFTRIYGSDQKPTDASMIDKPGEAPQVYRDAKPDVTQFEQNLWAQFWRLAEDEEFRKVRGVRVANGQGVWGPLEPGRLYTLTLESDGGLNMTSTPLMGIYKELANRRAKPAG